MPYRNQAVPGIVSALERVDKNGPGGCWLWLGRPDAKGYGRVKRADKTYRAHRYFYQELVGPIPDGLELDHLCRVRHCVNPDHLEPVTKYENSLRSDVSWALAAKTGKCVNGHPLTPDNCWTGKSGRRRMCKTCARERRHQRRTEGAA